MQYVSYLRVICEEFGKSSAASIKREDIEDWIENIPFSETRGYIQGVLRYAANYRRFYKE